MTSEPSPHKRGLQGSIWVFYHYMYPDSVVSAVLMDQLCVGLQQRGWTVTGISGNRSSSEADPPYSSADTHHRVNIRRIWRPAFRQSTSLGRLLNAAWMIAAWILLALDSDPPEAIVIGTDPILSVVTAIFWKFFAPSTRIVHWCFDLYPEAAYADGLLKPTGSIARLLTPLMRSAYRNCDALVDIGLCMRERLAAYQSPVLSATAISVTTVPWALEEPKAVLPSALEEREQIAPGAKLAMLYSGSFGRAHTFEDFLALAQALRSQSAALAFSVRGNREEALRAAVETVAPESACPIRFVPFASADGLLDRLSAPDIHLLSLSREWEGLVVPSKFFGALAVGRPVLFSGSAHSSIARWIVQYDLGWVLTPGNRTATARDIMAYVADAQRVAAMQQRCFETYQARFSKSSGLEQMNSLLKDLTTRQDF